MQDIAAYELIRIDPHLITLPLFEEVISNHKLKTHFSIENGDWEMLKQLVRNHCGVAIISNISLPNTDQDLIGIPLLDYFPKMPYGFFVKKDRKLSAEVVWLLEQVSGKL